MILSHDNRRLFMRSGASATPAGGRSLILGLGATGAAFARWLGARGESARVADTRSDPPEVKTLAELSDSFELVTGEFSADLLEGIDRLLVSPGVPGDERILTLARERSIPVLTDIDIFISEASAPVIAVTGSNGKSTVVSLLENMFSRANVSARAGGNIGTPALDLLGSPETEVFVLELSSFQLERTARLPVLAATILNVSPDHLDWHSDYAGYVAAKRRILEDAQSVVVNRHEPDICGDLQDRRIVSFGLDEPAAGHFGRRRHESGQWLYCGSEPIMGVDELYSTAHHDQLNVLAAMALGSVYGLARRPMAAAARAFSPLPHRMTPVRDLGGVRYVDDSKATNIGAALASIAAVEGPIVLVAGGDAKAADLSPLAGAFGRRLRGAVVIGQAADYLAGILAPLAPVEHATSMPDAVRRAAKMAIAGDTVLLAPCCASHDMFADYGARGDAFVEAVTELAR